MPVPFRNISIRTRLLISSTALVLTAALSILGYIYRVQTGHDRSRIFNHLESVATIKEGEVVSWSTGLLERLNLFAEDSHHAATIESLLLNGADKASRRRLRPWLQEFTRNTRDFSECFLLDRNGVVVLSTNSNVEGKFRGRQPYFRDGLAKPTTMVQTLTFTSASEGLNRVMAIQPIKNRSGQIIGMLAGTVSVERLNGIMQERSGLGETGETYLVGANAVLLTKSRFPGQTTPGEAYIHTEIVREALKHKNRGSGLYLDHHNVPVFGVYHWVPELQIALIAEQSQAEAQLLQTDALRTAGAGALAALLITLVIATLIARSVSTPLAELARKAHAVSSGNLEESLSIQRSDEIGLVADVLDDMKERLKGTIAGLSKAIETAEQSESKFHTLFNGTSDAIFVRSFTESGDAGPFIEVNDVACSRLGYSREELLQMSTNDILADGECHCLDNIHATLAKVGQTVFESAHRTKGGPIIQVEISSHQFLLDGKPVILSVARDITERKKNEHELRESYEKLTRLSQQQATIFDASPVGIAIVVDRIIIKVNKAFCDMMGYESDEVVRKNTCMFYPSQAAFERLGREAYPRFIEGRTYHTETDFRRKDGTGVSTSISGGAIDPHDLSAGSIWVFEDISERRHNEDKLRKLSQAIEQSPVSIIIVDLQGTIEFVNPHFTILTGYSADEAVGLKPSVLKSGFTAPEVYKDLWSTILSGRVWEGDMQNRARDGRLFWEHCVISPLRGADGTVTHYMAVKEDITEKKNLSEQLLQSQKLESIGQLAGGLAHDFNNILSVISGYAFLLKQELNENHKLLADIEQIQSASSRAAELTQSLLAYSRKQVMNPKRQNLNSIITKVGTLLTRLIGEHIELNISLNDDPLTVYADAVHIEQVLLNLATNARDAMPNGGVFKIATTSGIMAEEFAEIGEFDPTERYAVISVSDSGTGMDEQTSQRIFDPFFTTKEIGKGTGLGLSMVMGIVRQHRGYINVGSIVGSGTTFSIYLPLLQCEQSEQTVIAADAPVEGGSGMILLAEDDPGVRALMEDLLEMSGYRVVLAVDGQEAVEKFALHPHDIRLVILDMVMPRKNGKAAFEEIRRMNSATSVIYVSGYAADIIERQGELGPDAILLTKPVRPQELLRRVHDIIKK